MTRHAIRGALLNAEGQTEEEARKAGRGFSFPHPQNCQHTSGAKSAFAHSHGAYLITNAELEGSPASLRYCGLRPGMNPN